MDFVHDIAVKEEVKPQLDRIPVNQLQLYQSKAAKEVRRSLFHLFREANKEAFAADLAVSGIAGGRTAQEALYVDYPDVPVTTWLKEGCFTMLARCSGDIAVLSRCFILFCSVATYVLIMVHCYNDVPAFRALLATFVLTGADLLPKICHEAHEDIIDWAFSCFLLLLGFLTESQQLLSEDASMGLITGAAANIYKKIALLLVCTDEFRSAFRTSIMRFFHGSLQDNQGRGRPLLAAV